MVTATYVSRLQSTADAFRDALETRNLAAADQMARGWLAAQQGINVEMAGLLSRIESARLAGAPVSPAWLYQERRLARLQQVIREQMADWVDMAEEATRQATRAAAAMGQAHARQLTAEALDASLPGVSAAFTDINPANMAQLLANTAPGGPLRDLLVGIGGEMAEAAVDVLTRGLITGSGTAPMARELMQVLDIPRHRAETIARTEALRAYRETSRLTYQDSKVVGSWMWSAALDRRTCPACVVMHGTEHPVTETLDGHPRCRCAMIPKTKSWAEIDPSLADLPDTRPVLQPGKEWLAQQSPALQRQVLGPLKYDAWKRGAISLDDVVARRYSPEWGTMRRERSMIEIREGRNPNTLPGQAAPDVPDTWTPPWDKMDPETWDDAMRAVNPRYADGPEWQSNCTNATLAWELRRRGFDVKAQSRLQGRDLEELVDGYGIPAKDVANGTMLQASKAIAQMPEGSRGAIVVQWKPGGAHVFNWEIRGGEVHWIDGQPGRIHELEVLRRTVKGGKYGAFWWRMDNRPALPGWSDFLLDHSTPP